MKFEEFMEDVEKIEEAVKFKERCSYVPTSSKKDLCLEEKECSYGEKIGTERYCLV